MPRLELVELTTRRTTYLDPAGPGIRRWPLLRLRALVYVGSRPTRSNVAGRAIRAWVDTGAPITVFPELVWRAFQSDVTLFQRPRGAPVRNVHIAGQTHPYRLGRVSMGVLDPDVVADDRLDPTLASLAPRPVVAQFLFDRGTYTDLPLIGLWGSVTDGRHLRQTFQLGQTHNVLWWLSEA